MMDISIQFRLVLMVTLPMVIRLGLTVPLVNDEAMGFAEVSESVVRSLGKDPKELNVRITAFGETRSLRLVPDDSDIFDRFVDGYIADMNDSGHVIIEKIVDTRTNHDDIRSKLYTDDAGSASLYVERRDGLIALEGILDHETRIECRINRQGRSINEPNLHVVFKRAKTGPGTCLSMVPNITGSPSTDEHKVDTRALPALIQPEVLVVVDYQTSKYHNFKLDAIKKYLGIYFNNLNRRYANIASPKIQNVVTAIVLTNSESAENFIVYGSKPILDAGSTLKGFGKWITTQTSIKSDYDIAVWITALDLGILVNGKWSNQNVGVAYIGGACSKTKDMNFNVALGEDTPGSYNGIHTHAHEIAHLYGSAHDGEKVNNPRGNPGALDCSSKDGYIMSYEFKDEKKFYFSSCSVKQMTYTMESTSASCLLNTPKASVVSSDTTYPGKIRSLDNQCVDKHGSGFKFYEPRLSEVCIRLWCAPAPKGNFITMTTQGPALEGSPCGTGKICINGVCKNQ